MERSRIVPHISWSGPQPQFEVDAYLLAMLVRLYSAGLELEDESKRDAMAHPSVLTTENLHMVAVMYAYYKASMEEAGVKNVEDMLKLIKASQEGGVEPWLPQNDAAVRKAEAELLEYVETPGNPGFTCFG